jgi:hypothetical protein
VESELDKALPPNDRREWSEKTTKLYDAHNLLEQAAGHPTPGEIERIYRDYKDVLQFREVILLEKIKGQLENAQLICEHMAVDLGKRFDAAEKEDMGY